MKTIVRADEFKRSDLSVAEVKDVQNRLEACEDVLRGLASYVGNGGYNAPRVDPDVFDAKIRDGIDRLSDPLERLIADLREDRVKLQSENESLRQELRQVGVVA